MNIEELREYCLTLKDATETLYFENEYLIFRVFDKWFAVIRLNDTELNISVKCDPAKAIELRERFHCVIAAWHFNKKYWNNIILNRDMEDETVKYWIRHSVEVVVKKLPKKMQKEYWENQKQQMCK
jgi:predicted DNA-binding protein (MmcQ/YjbR family)